MRKKLQTILMAGLISFSVNSMADIAGDLASNLPVNEVLMNAVNSGMTLAEAVGTAVAAAPKKAGDIVAAASALVGLVSPEQCALDTDKKPLADCGGGIQTAAIAAGADPTLVADASAAGGAAGAGGGATAIGGGAAAAGGSGGNSSASAS